MLSGASDILQSDSYALFCGNTYEVLELALGSSAPGYVSSPSLLFHKHGGQITLREREGRPHYRSYYIDCTLTNSPLPIYLFHCML